jgi:hypothetical protein
MTLVYMTYMRKVCSGLRSQWVNAPPRGCFSKERITATPRVKSVRYRQNAESALIPAADLTWRSSKIVYGLRINASTLKRHASGLARVLR